MRQRFRGGVLPRFFAFDTLLTWAGYVATLQFIGLLGIYVKYVFLSSSSGLLAISRFLGRMSPADLTVLERLSFFAADALLNLIALPVVIATAAIGLARRTGFVLVAVCAVLLALFHFTEMITASSVGNFITWEMLKDAIRWGLSHPDSANEYVSTSALVKFSFVVAAALLLATLSVWPAEIPFVRLAKVAVAAGACVLFAIALIVPALSATTDLERLRHHKSGLHLQLARLLSERSVASEIETIEEMAKRYGELTGAPSHHDTDPYYGAEQGKDVIFFILETAPYRTFDRARELGWTPTLDSLLPNSFVATRHHSTYPYTSDALLSIFTGKYPAARKRLLASKRLEVSDSLTQQLIAEGYRFGVYAPQADTFEADMEMFKIMGASTTYIPDSAARSRQDVQQRIESELASFTGSDTKSARAAQLKDRLSHDLAAYIQLKEDVLRMKRAGERFVVAFLPQIGHAPWFDLYGSTETIERGAAAVRLQDAWLGELVDELRQEGFLESTIIVFTSDHGVRTRTEDPAFQTNAISEYSYHVPLLIYSPAAARTTQEIRALTSHIDIAPTVLTLLGAGDSKMPRQGAPIWHEGIDNRTTFFFGAGYLGVDGLRQGDKFISYETLTESAYLSDSLSSSAKKTALVKDEAEHYIALIREIRAIAESWNTARN
jgi:arylsulfatase A-like enzyme